jgi:hydrogenase-4 component F
MSGVLAIVGLPPFGLFISEFAIIKAGFANGRAGLMSAVLGLLVLGFVALLRHSNRILYGAPPPEITIGETSKWRIAPLFVSVAVLLALGLTLPAPLEALLNQVVRVVVAK